MRAAGPIVVLTLVAGCMQSAPIQSPRGVGFDSSANALDQSEVALAASFAPPPQPQIIPDPQSAPEAAPVQTARVPETEAAPAAAPEPAPVVVAQAAPAPEKPKGTGFFAGLFGGAKAKSAEPAATTVALAEVESEPLPEVQDDIVAATAAALALTAPEPVAAQGTQTAAVEPADEYVSPPLPVVPTSSQNGPSIVDYALATTHNPGQSLHARSGVSGNCGAYSTADFAQVAFLTQGGPEADPLGLDPDGDGFACNWTPVRLRAALQGN